MIFFKKKQDLKYELVSPDREVILHTKLYGDLQGFMQIRALKTFGEVNRGDLGGYILDGFLDHNGSCWLPKNCYLAYGAIRDCATVKASNLIRCSISRYATVEGCSIEGAPTSIGGLQESIRITGDAKIYRSLIAGEGIIADSAYICNVGEMILSEKTVINQMSKIVGNSLSLK